MWPEFIVIGTPKSGTTSLYQYLVDHPDVCPPCTKEVLFYDRNAGRGMGYYRSFFPLRRRDGTITGEASPYYFQHPLVAERVAATLPTVKCIVLLRDPVERAWSHYRHNVKAGREPCGFREALQLENERAQEDRKKMLSDDVFFPGGYLQYSYVDGGMYAKHLVRWCKHFPLNTQLHVIESSELFANPLKVLNEVARFLEIRDFEDCSFPAHNVGIPMVSDANDTAFLSSVFRDENERLFAILGTRYDWTGSSSVS